MGAEDVYRTDRTNNELTEPLRRFFVFEEGNSVRIRQQTQGCTVINEKGPMDAQFKFDPEELAYLQAERAGLQQY